MLVYVCLHLFLCFHFFFVIIIAFDFFFFEGNDVVWSVEHAAVRRELISQHLRQGMEKGAIVHKPLHKSRSWEQVS